jgi:hypothetical protein
MKSKYKKTIPALGLLLLSGAIAFPNTSDAMQLGVNLETKVESSQQYSDNESNEWLENSSNINTEVDLKDKEFKDQIRADIKAEHDVYIENKKMSTSTSYKEDRPSIFGRIWSFLVKDKDKDETEHNVNLNVSQLRVEVSDSDAKIEWSTNIESSGTLVYSTSTDFSNGTTITVTNTNEVNLSDLEANTQYYYKLTLDSNLDSQEATVKMRSFTTDSTDEEVASGPTLFWLRSTDVTSDSATIMWFTFGKSSSKVWIESDTNVDTSVDATKADSSMNLFHSLTVDDLEANTTYHFKVASTDKDGNTTISTLYSFTTRIE